MHRPKLTYYRHIQIERYIKMEFNEKLQLLRKQYNMTQEQLAEKTYVSRTAVSKWESGKGLSEYRIIEKYIQAFFR